MMVSPRRHRFVVAILAVAWWLAPSAAWSRTIAIAPYPITSVWPAAVRFLRVDRGFPVREKDESASYVLFDYTDGPKPCKGSLELIATTDPEGREATRIAISIPDMPRRYEQMFLDKFVAKLHEDQGPPAPPPRKPAPPPAPDAGPPQTTSRAP
ncbi:MAG TPA: hypothetical protein VF524_03430 [Polyangia bacterium]